MSKSDVTIPRFGPASQPGVLVLVSLLDGSKHGYAIANDIEDMVGRRPGPGALYGAIGRLEEARLIRGRTLRSKTRRPYSLTPRGREEAHRVLAEMNAIVRSGRARLRAKKA